MLTNQSNYYNDEPFPENESNADAYKRCSNKEDARIYCPKRWEAAEEWWADARMVKKLSYSDTSKVSFVVLKILNQLEKIL